ncbi:hypothetical protein ULVI_03750 [Cochleicola gelatinilyticus]|uniref:Endonuclease/exonuclease/phosphatase domain-containing protein n=2 Tax=Cochleicola gelatinilyticus TaxID=1763537 RepID=A0A167INV3_9FLAO|nr:hypothetical protein ULVI_03750 [Cochleicola gelatinilyticus]
MILLYCLSIFFSLSPFLPATEHPHWFFRTADFVRLQSIVIQLILLILLVVFINDYTVFNCIVLGSIVASMLYQLAKVYPYSSLYPRKKPDFPSDGMVSILAGNILQTNTEYDKFIEEVQKFDPDIVLTMESNKEWEKNLNRLEPTYSHSVKVANEEFYGMHVYSKIPLKNSKINFFIEDNVPSIFFEVSVNEKENIFFACLHPAPPSPTENETSKERDAELMIVGKKIRELKKPVVVCGDMNDVVWSRVTRLFKKMSGMIDPRIGRGFFPTYHAGYWFMRFPLDHLFHTKDLFVGKMIRTKTFGSDHFAMYYEIYHKKKAKIQGKTKLNGDEREEIEEKIEDGKS